MEMVELEGHLDEAQRPKELMAMDDESEPFVFWHPFRWEHLGPFPIPAGYSDEFLAIMQEYQSLYNETIGRTQGTVDADDPLSE